MGTKENPGGFDCYGNALPNEPMFILLARDVQAPRLVEDWAARREKAVLNGDAPQGDWPMIIEARRCAATMREWRKANDGVWRKQCVPGNGA